MYGIESAKSLKMLIFKAEIDFSTPAYSYNIVGNVLANRTDLPHTQYMMTKILKSSIPSYGIDVPKDQFHEGIVFSQGIDSVESMHRVLKGLKIRAQCSSGNFYSCRHITQIETYLYS
jgi:hypothetical protein